jgi:hypothetical protein
MRNPWPRKRIVKLVLVAAGPKVAEQLGLDLGLTKGTLRTWFSKWRWKSDENTNREA